VDRLDLEVHADGRGEVLLEGIVGEAEQDGRLAHARVADEQYLEDVVELAARHALWDGV